MITVEEAERIIMEQVADFGNEVLHFQKAMGAVLAEDLLADRDVPASDRATMDGIAISKEAFEKGVRAYRIKAVQAASDAPMELNDEDSCIEVMTGAALAGTADSVIRYEDVEIKEGIAYITIERIKQGQNIHKRGVDKKAGQLIVKAPVAVTPAIIGIAAFTGRETLVVKKIPKVVVISNGDELTEVAATPPPYMIRRSNSYTLEAALQEYGIKAELLHLPDDESAIGKGLKDCLERYDVLMLSGGVSMGKYDHIAKALEQLSVKKLFHKVQQRPGKPFWFGVHEDKARVFAFPGNPVSTFMCFHRYFIPWLNACLGLEVKAQYALLAKDVTFAPPLQYFLQVKLEQDKLGQMTAMPVEGNGSGDLLSLVEANAFMELPLEKDSFKQGDAYRIWPFKPLI